MLCEGKGEHFLLLRAFTLGLSAWAFAVMSAQGTDSTLVLRRLRGLCGKVSAVPPLVGSRALSAQAGVFTSSLA